jgi:hypothetical protein
VEQKQGELTPCDPGFMPYAYDEEGAKKLWEVSAKLTGVDE